MSLYREMDKENVAHIYNEVLLTIIKNEIVAFAEMWMNLETIIQNEVSQKEKNKCQIWTHLSGIEKNDTDESICKVEIETGIESRRVDTKGRINWETEIDTMNKIASENVLSNTGDY